MMEPHERHLSASEVMKLPREERNHILAESAVKALEDYLTNPELAGWDAFGEDDLYDDYDDFE